MYENQGICKLKVTRGSCWLVYHGLWRLRLDLRELTEPSSIGHILFPQLPEHGLSELGHSNSIEATTKTKPFESPNRMGHKVTNT